MMNENASRSPSVIWKISKTTRVQKYGTDKTIREIHRMECFAVVYSNVFKKEMLILSIKEAVLTMHQLYQSACKRIFTRKQLETLKFLTLVSSGWVIYGFFFLFPLTFPAMSTYPLTTD